MHRHLLLAVAAVAAVLALAGPAAADHHEPGVTLYRDVRFEGASQTFLGGDEIPRFESGAIGNDSVSSLRVDPGCQVTLYEHVYFRGNSDAFTEDVSDLSSTEIGNDRASSIQVECRYRERYRDDRRGYRDDRSGINRPGFYGGGDPERPGWYRGDQHDEDDYGDHGGWDARRGAALYSDSGFQGREEFFFESDPDLRDNPIRQDAASSVRVAPGCVVTIYEHSHYEGRSATLTEDTPGLGESWVGNDSASSIRVDCRGSGRRR